MQSMKKCISEYKKQIEKGDIVKAYRGLMEYIMGLRNHLANKYPDYICSGVYQGYMDMSYFSFTPSQLKDKKLKIALVLLHDNLRFEIWLSGANRQIQSEYARLFSEKGYLKYRITPQGKGVDSIIEAVLVDDPDFDYTDKITSIIERKALSFIEEILSFLSENKA